jgi:hypothetical protein
MQNLEGWRHLTNLRNSPLAWDDDDHMTPDINAARMRAKYYGAKVIINRPTLFAALHHEWSTVSIRPSESPLPGQGHPAQHASPIVSQTYHSTGLQRQDSYNNSPGQSEHRKLEELRPEIREGVEACINAAIRSTTAFDKVPPRLIVTNIFGTGHA